MNNALAVFVSALVSALIAGGTGVLTALSTIPAGTSFADVSWTVWAGICAGVVLAFGKDVQSRLTPTSNQTDETNENEAI